MTRCEVVGGLERRERRKELGVCSPTPQIILDSSPADLTDLPLWVIPNMTESRDGNDTGWETASSTSSTSTTSQLPPALIPVVQKRSKKRDKHSKPQRWGPPVNPLTQYWIERARLIKFLEKRFAKFQRKSREDYDRAKNPPRKQPAPTAAVPARQHLAPAVQQAVPAKQQAATAQTAQNPAVNHTRPNANQEVGTMNAAGAARGMLKRGVVGGVSDSLYLW